MHPAGDARATPSGITRRRLPQPEQLRDRPRSRELRILHHEAIPPLVQPDLREARRAPAKTAARPRAARARLDGSGTARTPNCVTRPVPGGLSPKLETEPESVP